MCYYNSIKVTRDEYERLLKLEKQIAHLNDDFAIFKGFDYNSFPVVVPAAGHTTVRKEMQWGFLPSYLKTKVDVKHFREGYKNADGRYIKGYTTLNATSEEILNRPFFRDAALNRRCLIPSAGFYEWRHVQVVGKSGKLLKTPEKFPYLIRMRNQEEFYMAGIYNPWTDKETNITINTFALLTTTANTLMKQIHNSKERQPTILPGNLAEAWLYNDLTMDEILDIGNYQAASSEMEAIPLDKNFLKCPDPHAMVVYNEVAQLVY